MSGPPAQLLSASQGASTTESYTYDPVGNRLRSLSVSPYSYNTSNELQSTPSTSYTYDANGNTITKSDSSGLTQYSWDFENRLTQVTLAGQAGTLTFKYDPFGRRIQKSGPNGTVNYTYNATALIEEVDSNGNVLARYTQGPGIDQPLAEVRSGTTSYYQQDGLGSVTSLSDGTGALGKTYGFDSFGNLTSSTGTLINPLQYTGREVDSETGLYFYRARYYDSGTGRFLSEDPIRFRSSINLYPYVMNRPVKYRDPWGKQGEEVAPCVYDCIHSPAEQAQIQLEHDRMMFNLLHTPDPTLQLPVSDPIPNAVSAALTDFLNCVGSIKTRPCVSGVPHIDPSAEGNSETPGPADFGVVPGEGTIDVGNLDNTAFFAEVKACLRRFPLAALARGFNLIRPGDAF